MIVVLNNYKATDLLCRHIHHDVVFYLIIRTHPVAKRFWIFYSNFFTVLAGVFYNIRKCSDFYDVAIFDTKYRSVSTFGLLDREHFLRTKLLRLRV
jgi:hypothetical protein